MSHSVQIAPPPGAEPIFSPRPSLLNAPGERILLADPDETTMLALARALELQGYQVCRCSTLEQMRDRLTTARWDVLVVDPRLAGPDASALLGNVTRLPNPPAIVVSSVNMTEIDRIVALELGAQHCVAKPYSIKEMQARIRALLARRQPAAPRIGGGKAIFADLQYDPVRRQLTRIDGLKTRLSPTENDLLMLFLAHPRKVLSREDLLTCYADQEMQRSARAVDVLVSRLRDSMISRMPKLILTIRGRGYMLAHDVIWE